MAEQPRLTFRPLGGSGLEAQTLAANAPGLAQNDPRFGDIRIGAHRFDGAGRTLAHAYTTPGGATDQTITGDAHFDQAENWVPAPTAAAAPTGTASPSPRGVTALFFAGADVLR